MMMEAMMKTGVTGSPSIRIDNSAPMKGARA